MLVLVLEFSRISAASASRSPVGARVLHAGTSGPVGHRSRGVTPPKRKTRARLTRSHLTDAVRTRRASQWYDEPAD